MRLGIFRIERDCPVQQENGFFGGDRRLQAQGPRAYTEIISLRVARSVARRRCGQAAHQSLDNLAGHLVLNSEDILEAPIESFSPQMVTSDRVDQLCVDPYLRC